MWVPHVELVCQTKSKRRISETTLQNYLGSQIALVLIVGESRYLILWSIDMNHIEAIVAMPGCKADGSFFFLFYKAVFVMYGWKFFSPHNGKRGSLLAHN